MISRPGPLVLGAAALLLSAGQGVAGHRDRSAPAPEEVRAAVERGEIRPLADLRKGVLESVPGDIVGIDLERRRGVWCYEFRVVSPDGAILEVYVDAASGRIERVERK